MAKLSKDAFVVMAACEKTNQHFGITVDRLSPRQYKFVWAFRIDKEKAHKEGYDSKTVTGNVTFDEDYRGCPYCKEKRFIVCSACNKLFCYHGKEFVVCPHCGNSGNVVGVERIDLQGGGF